jgi:hypothetical protein
MDALDVKIMKWPGHGLGKDVTMQQIVEGEYMKADEYDWLMMDPTDYNLRVTMPRTTGLFEPFKNLPPLRMLMGGANWVGILANPEIRKVFQTLMDLSGEFMQHQAAIMEVGNVAMSRGYPSFFGGVMAQAPYDFFADMQRGTRGIILDLYRQPDKLLEAIDIHLDLTIKTAIKNFPITNCPVCMMPLHKGDDTFMSDKQFEKFYWPSLQKLFMAMIEEGLVPFPFAEGIYNSRLKLITDTPKSGVVWYFDKTDMAQAKKVLGNTSFIDCNDRHKQTGERQLPQIDRRLRAWRRLYPGRRRQHRQGGYRQPAGFYGSSLRIRRLQKVAIRKSFEALSLGVLEFTLSLRVI